MDARQTAQEMIRMVSLVEQALFAGPFSEGTIEEDLQSRKALDAYRTMGNNFRQPDALGEKKDFYRQELNSWIESMDMVLELVGNNPTAGELISRAKKNKKQAQKMLDFVRRY